MFDDYLNYMSNILAIYMSNIFANSDAVSTLRECNRFYLSAKNTDTGSRDAKH